MGKLLWLMMVIMVAAVPARASAQRNGTWDVPCDSYLGPRFAFPFATGVIFKEKEFLTNWRSTSPQLPHPSYNWYEATPNRDPVSTDGLAIWYYAQVGSGLV